MNRGATDAPTANAKQQAAASACCHAFVGRQPIYDRRLEVVGYELLFRAHGDDSQAGIVESEKATAQVLLNTFLDIGIQRVASSRKAFVNFGRSMLLSDSPRALPPGLVVLEVLETVTVDEPLVRAIGSLRQAGYQIALDDFTGQPHLRPLIHLADIIKVDLPGCADGLAQRAANLRRANLKLLAEKVETRQQFRLCMELGFDYFQGYFLRRPDVVEGRRAPTLRNSVVKLMEKLCDPDVQLHEIERLIQNDVSLCYKLLRLSNSAILPAQNTVASVRQALQLVGLQTVTIWTGLLLLAGLSDKPSDVLHAALLRANMCQLLAPSTAPAWANTSFLVGLFSVLDLLLDQPIEDIIQPLSLSPEVKQALVARQGVLGETLQIVLDYEQGQWDKLAGAGPDDPTIVKAYLDALAATDAMTGILRNHS